MEWRPSRTLNGTQSGTLSGRHEDAPRYGAGRQEGCCLAACGPSDQGTLRCCCGPPSYRTGIAMAHERPGVSGLGRAQRTPIKPPALPDLTATSGSAPSPTPWMPEPGRAAADHMFRSPRDALDVLRRLNDCGVNLHVIAWAATSPATASESWSSAIAEAERDRTRERVAKGEARPVDARPLTWVGQCRGATASVRPAICPGSPRCSGAQADAEAARARTRAAGDRRPDEGRRRVDQPRRSEERPGGGRGATS